MPLPDERPRQSVANLIGRFEKQKSASGAAAPPPPVFGRTSSVASHLTGDSAQEELKERREWPPRSVQIPATSLSSPVPGPEKRLSTASLATDKEPSLPHESPTDPQSESSPPPTANPTRSMPPKTKTPPPNQKKHLVPASRPSSIIKSPAPKPVVKPASTPLKHTASGGSTSSTPSKPQHISPSVASPTPVTKISTKRVSASPRPPTAASPARARTPLSTARSKTPLSHARPKTPSGLYAPTAASLARSRTGPPDPPPSEKPKRKLTTDLSKPTAASASRMRTPAATPARGGKTPAKQPHLPGNLSQRRRLRRKLYPRQVML
ncbi:hypothetical protein K439DRAFT_1066819 [Ramaria rubella]|nr:hypothetical protein K439DRAFT_1066819 [Ramaria rubella]